MMKGKLKPAIFVLLFAAIAFVFFMFVKNGNLVVLNPAGLIGAKESDLMINAVLLMLIVVIPVFILLFFFAWHYREGNEKAKYMPNWEHAKMEELIWWAIPFEIVLVLGALTWGSTHELDPHQPIVSDAAPITIQVVALDWKWLFIYPEQNIATVNFVEFPEKTPINFEITADGPMNSFWIPELGGQIYAMAGMKTPLHLIAGETGSFAGSSSNFSGAGFAGMKFTAKAVSESDFNAWVAATKQSPTTLSLGSYSQLAKPSENNPSFFYGSVQNGLYEKIVNKFMSPTSGRLLNASITEHN